MEGTRSPTMGTTAAKYIVILGGLVVRDSQEFSRQASPEDQPH